MAKVILVRHGETDWCREKRLRGEMDIPLNSDGKDEAQKIADKLAKMKINAVYSSEAACSFSTASEIASQQKLKPRKVSELNELNLGLWQGLLLKDVKRRYKKQYGAWKSSPVSVHPPGGESTKEAYDRAVSAMQKLIDRHKEENICIVSGSTTLSMIKGHLKNMNLEKMWQSIPPKMWWEVLEI
jgi:probable phosphoglycerate mutase